MNFGNDPSIIEVLFALLMWGLPLALLVWFIRTVGGMAESLREIADRLSSLERAVRETVPQRPPPPPL